MISTTAFQRPTISLVLSIAAMLCWTTIASANVAINFSGRLNGANDVPDLLLVESGASSTGAAGVNGTTEWNDIIATGGAGSGEAGIVVTGTGGITAVVDWMATGTWSASASSNRIAAAEDASGDMKDGHIEGNSPTGISVTISELDAFLGSYDVYVYVGHDATGIRSGVMSINGGADVPYSTAVFDGTFTEGQDYLLFSDISGSSFTIVGGGNDQDNRSGIHGIEIIGAVIPEPASLLLLALGLTIASATRRRR